MQCIYGQMQISIYNLMHRYQNKTPCACMQKQNPIAEKYTRSRLLELPHVFHKLLLVNQSLELAVMQNAHVSKTKFDEALIDQV